MARLEGVREAGLSLARLVFFFVKRKLGRVPRPLRIHALAPRLIRGYARMEMAQEGSTRVPKSLKKLGQVRVATRIGCPF